MQANSHYRELKTFLNQPFTAISKVGLSRSRGIIPLSYMAEGLVSYAIQQPDKKKDGIVAAATGLALNGSKSIRDYLTYYQINIIVLIVDILANIRSSIGNKSWEKLSHDLLATSIRFNAETKVPW